MNTYILNPGGGGAGTALAATGIKLLTAERAARQKIEKNIIVRLNEEV